MAIEFADQQAQTNFAYIRQAIEATQCGRALMTRVDNSIRTCRISFVPDADVRADGGASAAPINPATDKIPGRAILNLFAPAELCRTYIDVDKFSPGELEALWAQYARENGDRNLGLAAALVTSGLTDIQVIDRVHWPENNAPFVQQDLDALRAAQPDCSSVLQCRLWREHLWRLIWLLRPYILPGRGADTRVRIGDSIGQYYSSYLPDVIWRYSGWMQFQDAHVIVVHELVHALRIMEGRRVVDRGWEEEAMTVGLAPFDSEEFSENRYRRECAMALAGAHNDPAYSSQSASFARLGGGDPKNIFSGPRGPR